MSRRSTSLAYGVLPLLVSTVRLPASPNVVSTSLALSIALLAIPPTAVQDAAKIRAPSSREGPDDHIRSGPSAAPPTRNRPVPVSTVSSSIISSLHGKCAPEDNGVSSNSSVWPGSTHPHGCRTYAISVGCATRMRTDFRWLLFLTINSSCTCGTRHTSYRSTMVVSTQGEEHVHHTDLYN